MISRVEVDETNKMIDDSNLDIRTITMGISLLDCADSDIDNFNNKIYEKIIQKANSLVAVGDELEKDYGVPIINKRISVTPIAIAAAGCDTDSYLSIAKTLDKVAHDVDVNFIGGFSALVENGFSRGDEILIDSIPEVLSKTERVCSSVNVASSKAGINMDAVKKMGEVIKDTAFLTKERDSIGCTKLVVFSNSVENNPFMAGAYHGVSEADSVINVGVSGPGVVKTALANSEDADFEAMCEIIKKTAFKITRAGQLIGQEASKRLNVPFGIIDLSLAPTPSIGDSIAEIFQEMGIEEAGAHGTTAALAILNDNVKKGGIMASSFVGGLSGAFIPVSEDHGMINSVEKGALSVDKLEAMTCVCSVGLDMIAIPGDTSNETISAIIADEAAIGMINNKTTAVRLIPAIDKKEGDYLEFGGLLGRAPVMNVNNFSADKFINRGGRVPAPVHSFKN